MDIVRFLFRKFHFRTTIIVPFVLQTTIAVGLVGYFFFIGSQQAINNVASQLRSELSSRIEDKLKSYKEIPQAINQLNASAFSRGIIDVTEVKGEAQLWQQMQIYPSISGIYCGDETGGFFGYGRASEQDSSKVTLQFSNAATNLVRQKIAIDEDGNRAQPVATSNKPYDPRTRPWYQKAKAVGESVWSEIYLDFITSYPTVTASLPVYRSTDKSLIGVCGTDFFLPREMTKFLQSLKIGKTGTVFIMERSGQLVATSAQESILQGTGEKTTRIKAIDSPNPVIKSTAQLLQNRFQNLYQIQSIQQVDFKLKGDKQYVQLVPFQDLNIDWLIVITIPESDFMEQIYTTTYRTFLLSAGVLVLTILLGLITSQWIINPIKRVTKASNEIAKGNLNQKIQSSVIVEIASLSHSFNIMTRQLKDSLEALHLANEELESRVEQRTGELRQEKERSEQLLLNILPEEIADRLMRTNESPAEHFEEATILFADIVGFTSLSARMDPLQLVGGLNQIFSAFDHLTEKYGLEKIKTIGDAYMVVGGLPTARDDHAEAIANMALDMQAYMQEVEEVFGESLQIRIGINTGSVIAGVIGIKKFIYDLWGDAVNVASRMESHGKPGAIQVTDATYNKLKEKFLLEARGEIEVKGRGEMMTYWLISKRLLLQQFSNE